MPARTRTRDPRLDIHLHPDELRETLRRDVRAGLTATPKTLPSKYFYDARGSALFVDITRLPEYYPTRAEAAILTRHADEIAAVSGADWLVELGSGASEKTRRLLHALEAGAGLRGYVPFDVSADALTEAMDALAQEFPGLEQHGVVGDFERHLRALPHPPRGGTRMVAFLGSTIGNLDPGERARFLDDLRGGLAAGDTLLLGTDLVKDTGRLVAAYDDAAGVTAEFNRNVLHVLRRELGADVDPADFEHVAVWNAADRWIEMRLRARRDLEVRVADLGLAVRFAAGEEVRTEISAKFGREQVRAELAAAGYTPLRQWTDPDGDFALTLARLDQA